MGTLCRPVYKDYWFGVADNWGKAELDGDNLYCQKYGVSCLFFLENLAMHHARRLFFILFFLLPFWSGWIDLEVDGR